MQTILENLEETYLHLQNILDDDQRGLVELDTENREDIYISFCDTMPNREKNNKKCRNRPQIIKEKSLPRHLYCTYFF